MAPIQNKTSNSYPVHKSTTTHHDTPSSRRSRETPGDSWDFFLPVTRRGRFFQDSFFESARSHFDDAVRDALSRWDDDSDFFHDSWHEGTSSPRLSNLSRYRQMRSRREDGGDNLAVTVTSDNDVHKIVLDVHDFVEGDLKVKVVGERELLVEGRKEKTQQDAASSLSTQTFSRRFTLPEEADMAAIDSVMSSDGILTITAPKVGRTSSTSRLEKSGSSSTTSSSKNMQEEREPCECEKCNPRLHTRENTSQMSTERSQSRFSDDSFHEGSEQKDGRFDSARRANSYSQDEKKNTSSETSSQHRLMDKMDVPIRAFFNSRPITKRGRFFDDSFFEDTRSDYRSAIQDILSKWGERSSTMDDMTSYRKLRTKDLRDDNQAVRTIEDDFQHKFIVDVQDFMKDGEINVKAVDDRELVVEGHVEKQEGGSKSIKRFSRRFLLPEDVHLESVSSVMSSDGVLTIIAPKKNAVPHMKNISSPFNTQNLENNSEVYEKRISECIVKSYDSHGGKNVSVEEGKCNSGICDTSACNVQSTDHQMHEEFSKEAKCSSGTYEVSQNNIHSSEDQMFGNISKEAVTSSDGSEYDNRASSTACTVIENTSYGGEDESACQSSANSRVFEVDKVCGGDGHNITICVDEAEDQDMMEDEERCSRERSHDITESEVKEARQKFDDIELEMKEAKQKLLDELLSDQRSVRAKTREASLEADARSNRGAGLDDLDIERSIREGSMDSRGMRQGNVRFEGEFDSDEALEDDVNFEGSSRQHEKKLRSILKTPERYLQEEDERQSRERSYTGEEAADAYRRTPNRDTKKKTSYGPLNPDSKRTLPISIRGHFYSDSFFDDFHENFKTAVSDVLLKYNEKSSSTDDITAYRNLRFRDPKLENQAFHVQEDQGAHRVVLDVKDFINGDIEAAIYDERELVIEGRAERRTGTSITTLSFLRRFPLPENVDTDAITIVMSSDGVLTAVTPWKGFSGLSAIKNILSTEDKPIFDRPSEFDRRWDEADWESSRASEDFLNRSIDSRLRSRLRHATDDLF